MKLRVNGTDHEIAAPGDMPLLWVRRDLLGLTGTKYGCGVGQCGACLVHSRRQAAPVVHDRRRGGHEGKAVTTIEG